MQFPWIKLFKDADFPAYAHYGDAAQDLRLHLSSSKLQKAEYYKKIYGDLYFRFIDACHNRSIELSIGESFLMPTGISLDIPNGIMAMITPRSGLASKGITIPNSPGIVDSGYKYRDEANLAEIFVILKNQGQSSITFSSGERIAQITFIRYVIIPQEYSGNERIGGFGSSGIK